MTLHPRLAWSPKAPATPRSATPTFPPTRETRAFDVQADEPRPLAEIRAGRELALLTDPPDEHIDASFDAVERAVSDLFAAHTQSRDVLQRALQKLRATPPAELNIARAAFEQLLEALVTHENLWEAES